MHKFFAVDNAKGLVSIIVGATPFQDTIHQNTHDRGLDLITSGPIPPNPTELLMTGKFKQLLDDLNLRSLQELPSLEEMGNLLERDEG